jgi:hypothetical protein
MSSPQPRYKVGPFAVQYDYEPQTVVKRELRNGMWWYKIRPYLNIMGGQWVPENDPYLRYYP